MRNGINTPFQNYDRYVEVEIPSDTYLYMGYAAKQNERYRGGATQIWLEDDVIKDIADGGAFDWNSLEQQAQLLPQY